MPDIHDAIDEIVMWHRDRSFFMEQRKRGHLALASNLRTRLGWSPVLPEKESSRIRKQALELVKTGRENARALKAGKPFDCDEPDYLRFQAFILAALAGDEHAETNERIAEKNMIRLAESLPVWAAWAKYIHGFGALGLAIIVGEAGDLSGYATHSKLWKRMGVAVMGPGDGVDDVRQGGLKKGAAAEDWIAHGYSRQRRSRLFTIGDSLIKKPNPYRDLYLERKGVERVKLPDASKMHIHRRAQRYMEKRLLRDLWKAWRRASGGMPEGATHQLPAADELEDAA